MDFPKEFIEYTSRLFGEERWQRFLDSFGQETPVSVRYNPFKPVSDMFDGESVPWCKDAYWLKDRPKFTLDPLLHAGAYYVQEAGSMFLDQVLRQYVFTPVCMLDLCAAPGGKSTLARAALPEGSLLISNEPDRRRANILMENMQKQGHHDVYVTNNYAKDFQASKIMLDVILTDVPCSGEGMFRRDEGAIKEWSVQNVRKCAELQRSIVGEIWHCLRPGGLLIYSTCTFNLQEDEENVRWIMEELGADILPVETRKEWNITGSLLESFDAPVYRFIPGITRSEGLFMCVLRKHGESQSCHRPVEKQLKRLRILYDGVPKGERKGKDIIPSHAEALLAPSYIGGMDNAYPCVELSREDALRYLHREAIVLSDDTPKGYVAVTYNGLKLGFVKNLGNRANNLYPKEWAIRNLN
ncbi:MAG: hypothetical protein K2G12_10155 [Prevotella sp.]|nr:hypothetical protein [Prevotella sp.]